MSKLTIYLAGAMGGLSLSEMNDWRQLLSLKLKTVASDIDVNLTVINPVDYFNFEENRYQSEREIMDFDLAKVRKSDIVIVDLDKLDTSVGSMIECYEAYKQGIPVLAFGSNDDYEKLHPWIKTCITRHDRLYKETVMYVRDFYMH